MLAFVELHYFKSYLSDHYQFVAVNEEMSYQSKVQYGNQADHR